MPARTRRTLKTVAVDDDERDAADERERAAFWNLAGRALDQLDTLHFQQQPLGPSIAARAYAVELQRGVTFPVMDHQLHCWHETVIAVRAMPPLLTAGPARIEAGA